MAMDLRRRATAPAARTSFREQAALTSGTPWTGMAAAAGILVVIAAVSAVVKAIAGWQPLDIRPDALTVLLMLPVGLALAGIQATGEEIAWRGYLHTRLSRLGQWQATGVIAVIWVVWHVPLLMTYLHLGQMSERLVIVTLMNLGLASLTLGALRRLTASVWPAVVAHALLNTMFVYVSSHLVTDSAALPEAAFWLASVTGRVMWVLAALALAAVTRTQIARCAQRGRQARSI